MKKLTNASKHHLWLPNYITKDVLSIDFKHLKKLGIKACLFDLDHTLLVHGTIDLSTRNTKHLEQSGMKIYIATNRQHSDGLDKIAQELGADGIMHARGRRISKPAKKYYEMAVEMTDFKPSEVAMVGDRLMQDIWGARRAGLTAILVEKFGKIKWYDQILTVHDRLIPILFRNSYKDL